MFVSLNVDFYSSVLFYFYFVNCAACQLLVSARGYNYNKFTITISNIAIIISITTIKHYKMKS